VVQESDAMARIPSSTRARRRAYSASIVFTGSIGPVSAASAAFCAIEVGLEVEWLCRRVTACAMGSGAST
jgi:hypothetical protein